MVPERKWFQAMGADWDDLDVLSQPLQSSSDFLERLKPSLDAASASGRDVLIAYLPSARKAIEAQNVNFDNIVLGTCARCVRMKTLLMIARGFSFTVPPKCCGAL